MIAIKEIILLATALLSRFKSSATDAEIHFLPKRRISIWWLLKLPLWRVLVVLLLGPIVKVFLITVFSC